MQRKELGLPSESWFARVVEFVAELDLEGSLMVTRCQWSSAGGSISVGMALWLVSRSSENRKDAPPSH